MPFSIDTAWFTSIARAMMVALGRGSTILTELADAALMKGDNIDMFRDIIKEGLVDIEQELKQNGRPERHHPYRERGGRPPVRARRGAHHPADGHYLPRGQSKLTLSLEAANYFLGDLTRARKVADRIVNEAKRLGVKEMVLPSAAMPGR